MLRYLARGLGLVAGLYIALVAHQLWTIQHELGSARDRLSDLSLESFEDADGLREVVDPILGSVRRADDAADGPVLAPIAALPAIGDQITGLRTITSRVEELATIGDGALEGVEDELERTGEPGTKVLLADAVVEAVDTLGDALADLPDLDDPDLFPPLRDAARELDAELAEAADEIDVLRGRAAAARDLLVGPTDILLLAANNAEIRAGMGMHLSAGIVTLVDGEFETTAFFSTTPLQYLTEGRADVPPELERMYRPVWDFGKEWRTTSTSPNFPAVGAIFGDLSSRTEIGEVDAIVSIDAPALSTFLEATGPVEVRGRTIDSENAVDVLLRDNYLELGDPRRNTERRELQSDVATAIFDAVTERDVNVVGLAAGISDAAEGRHVLAWSPDPAIQDLWEALGADGALSEDSFLVSFQNAAASKRDYYTDTNVRIVPAGTDDAGRRRYRAIATLTNPVVEPSAPYIDSLNRYVPVGVHRAFVTFTLPDGVTDIEVVNGRLSSRGTDGPTTVANLWLRVPEGESRDVAIDFTVPADLHAVEVLPSARIRPTVYEFGPQQITDEVPKVVALPRVAAYVEREPQLVEASALVLLFLGLVLVVKRSRRLEGPDPDREAAAADARLAGAMLVIALATLIFARLS